jgi:hypothetical protein
VLPSRRGDRETCTHIKSRRPRPKYHESTALAPIIPVVRLCRLGRPAHLASHGPLLGQRDGEALSFSTGIRSLGLSLSRKRFCRSYLRSQSSPVQSFLLLYSLVYTRSVSLLRNRISRPCSISQATMLSLVTLSLSLLLSFATAQSTAVSWFEPGPSAGSFAYAGEVLDACPGTTVLALQCTSAGSDNAMTALCGTDAPVRLHHYATGYSICQY